jgi:hypothetical protein
VKNYLHFDEKLSFDNQSLKNIYYELNFFDTLKSALIWRGYGVSSAVHSQLTKQPQRSIYLAGKIQLAEQKKN